MRIHGDDRSVAVTHGRFGRALQVEIDGQLQALPGHGGFPAQHAHLPPVAIHDDVLRAVLPAQKLIVGLLDSRFAHHIAGLVVGIARVVQHVVAHFADVADQVGGEAVAGIKPPLLVDCLQFGKLVAMRLDELLLIRSDVLLERNRLILGRGA